MHVVGFASLGVAVAVAQEDDAPRPAEPSFPTTPDPASSRHWLLAGMLDDETKSLVTTDEEVLAAFLSEPSAAIQRKTAAAPAPTTSPDSPPSLLQSMVDQWTTRPVDNKPAVAGPEVVPGSENPFIAAALAPATPVSSDDTPSTSAAGMTPPPSLAAPEMENDASTSRSSFRPPESDAKRYFPQLKRF